MPRSSRTKPGLLLWFGLLGLAILVLGCSVELDPLDDSKFTQVPDLAMRGTSHQVIRDGKPLLIIEAEQILVFIASNRREMDVVSFVQLGPNGQVEARGRATKAVQDIASGDVTFSQGIELDIEGEDTRLATSDMTWRAADKVFAAPSNAEVRMSQGSATSIVGRGFVLETMSRTIRFEGGASGTLADQR